jgi:hypothetical protein
MPSLAHSTHGMAWGRMGACVSLSLSRLPATQLPHTNLLRHVCSPVSLSAAAWTRRGGWERAAGASSLPLQLTSSVGAWSSRGGGDSGRGGGGGWAAGAEAVRAAHRPAGGALLAQAGAVSDGGVSISGSGSGISGDPAGAANAPGAPPAEGVFEMRRRVNGRAGATKRVLGTRLASGEARASGSAKSIRLCNFNKASFVQIWGVP